MVPGKYGYTLFAEERDSSVNIGRMRDAAQVTEGFILVREEHTFSS